MMRVLRATFKPVLQQFSYPNAWNRLNRKGPREFQMLEKRNFIPMQNTHDLLVGTPSIGIRSLFSLVSVVDHCTQ